jgi:leucyl aminopeptidase
LACQPLLYTEAFSARTPDILCFSRRVGCRELLTMFTGSSASAIPLHLLYEDDFPGWIAAQSDTWRAWVASSLFKPERHRVLVMPSADGKPVAALVGLGRRTVDEQLQLWQIAGLPDRLPDGDYVVATHLGAHAWQQFALGWAYGQYRFERYKRSPRREVNLVLPEHVDRQHIERLDSACNLARDLVNTPTNDLGPEHLEAAAHDVAQKYGARWRSIVGDDLLKEGCGAIHAVGRASASAPRLIDFEWGSPTAPKVTLVGKGVCFDSGGLDLKPPAGMLMMKKDMGGAASVLALAKAIMDAKLPIRLRVLIPAVENAVSSNAFRPGDVLKTKKGLTVEVGNTDAEGRLILCDALAIADAEQPDLLIDLATLTGAARTALGPELPALFCGDEKLSGEVQRVCMREADPVWPLPLWTNYDDELGSKIADLNNVSSSAFAGSIFAALYLKRFVTNTRHWVHLDIFAWNPKERPGRPVGAEPQCVRGLYAFLHERYSR